MRRAAVVQIVARYRSEHQVTQSQFRRHPRDVRRLCRVQRDGIALLDRAYDRLRLSARACDRVVKVAQTIADLEGAVTIQAAHLGEALSYRLRAGGVV